VHFSEGNGIAAGSEIGTNVLQSIENVIAGSGGDRLTGSREANRIEGGAGNDKMTESLAYREAPPGGDD
jgi:hypothetical protein